MSEQKREPLPAEPAEFLKRLYLEEGYTILRISQEYLVSYRVARATLVDAGVKFRPSGPLAVQPATSDMVSQYNEGATIRDVATRHGHTYPSMRRRLYAAGVTIRRGVGRQGQAAGTGPAPDDEEL